MRPETQFELLCDTLVPLIGDSWHMGSLVCKLLNVLYYGSVLGNLRPFHTIMYS